MGTTEWDCEPLCNLLIETLVPADHFYRRPDAQFGLSFVRELLAGC